MITALWRMSSLLVDMPAILHSGRHPNPYIDRVNARLMHANDLGGEHAVRDELFRIRSKLESADRNASWYDILEWGNSMTVYKCYSDGRNGSLIELSENIEEYIAYISLDNLGKKIQDNVIPKYKISHESEVLSDKFDLSACSTPFFIFSERAYQGLKHLLWNVQVFEVSVERTSKRFLGMHVIQSPEGVVDMSKSDTKDYDGKIAIRKPVFYEDACQEYDFFVVEGAIGVFVSEKFKATVSKLGLNSFCFKEQPSSMR